MTNPIVLHVICALFWEPIRVNCEVWVSYKAQALYADKICSGHSILNEMFASNLLYCLSPCRNMADCSAVIYNKKSKTCYILRSGFQHDDCSLKLSGAQLYSKDTCPLGGVVVNGICYIMIDKEQDQASSLTTCRRFGNNAQLADLMTFKEMLTIQNWLYSTSYDRRTRFWLGPTYVHGVGWTLGDGRRIKNSDYLTVSKVCVTARIVDFRAHNTECSMQYRGLCAMKTQ